MNNYEQHNRIPSAPMRPQWLDYPSTNLIGNYIREQSEPSYEGVVVPTWAVYLLSLPFTLTAAQLILASVAGGSVLVSTINSNPLGYIISLVLMSVAGQLIYGKLAFRRSQPSGLYLISVTFLATVCSWILCISAFGWWTTIQMVVSQ